MINEITFPACVFTCCVRVCVCERETVLVGWMAVCKAIRKEMMQKENHRSGQCWCMAPPSCPPPIGDVNPERYLFPPPSWMSTISMVGKSAADTTAARQKEKKKKSRTDTLGASSFFFNFFICALWPDHTLNIGCRCGLIGASHTLTLLSPPSLSTNSFDGSSPTGTYQKRTKPKKKKKRGGNKITDDFFFCVCVMSVHVLICTAAAAQCHRSVFPNYFIFI